MDTKPWWQSKTIWGVLIAAISGGLKNSGVEIGDSQQLTDSVLTVVTAIGAIVAVVGRVKAKTAITATKEDDTPKIPPARLVSIAIIGSLFSILAFSACTTTSPSGGASVADKATAFARSPAGQALANTVINVALDGATQYAGSGKIDSHLLVANTLDGAAENLRGLAGQSPVRLGPASPNSIYHAVADGIDVRAVSQQVAPLVAANVTRQIENGAPPDQAIENLATTMNAAAARTRKANAGP